MSQVTYAEDPSLNVNFGTLSAAKRALDALVESLREAGLQDDLKLVASARLIDMLGQYGDVSTLTLAGGEGDGPKVNCFGVSADDFIQESTHHDVVFGQMIAEEARDLMDIKGDANLSPNHMVAYFTELVARRYDGMPRVLVNWQPQAWQNDHAVDVDGAYAIDITPEVLTLPHDSDFLNFANQNDMWLEGVIDTHPLQIEHGGPYRLEVEMSLQVFLKQVAGRDLGEPFTAEQWEGFKASYRTLLAQHQERQSRSEAPRAR